MEIYVQNKQTPEINSLNAPKPFAMRAVLPIDLSTSIPSCKVSLIQTLAFLFL